MKESKLQSDNPLNVNAVAESVRSRLRQEGLDAEDLTLTSESEEADSHETLYGSPKPDDGTEKLGNLSKIVDTGDPVILMEEETQKEVWYIDNITEDEEGETKITIHYRAEDAELEEYREVGWEDITPRFNDAEMYTQKIGQYRTALKKARADENKRVRYRLGQLLEQLTHFGRLHLNRQKN